jgi:DNA polymerase-3 subunit gamma/tau
MLEVSEAEAAVLADQSQMASPEGLTRILEVFGETEMRLRDAASKKILVEVALLKAIEARTAMSIDAVLKQLQDLRAGNPGTGGTPASQPAPARALAPKAPTLSPIPSGTATRAATPAPAPVATVEVRETAPAAQPSGVSNLAQLWSKLLEAVGRASPFTRTYLLGAHPVSLGKNALTIGFDPSSEDQIGLVDTPTVHALLRTKLAELGHPNMQAKFVVAENPAGAEAISAPAEVKPQPARTSTPQVAAGPAQQADQKAPAPLKSTPIPFNKDDFKNDPLIQKALEVFKAQIVELRTTN